MKLFLVISMMVSAVCAQAQETTQSATVTSPYPPVIDPDPPVSYEQQVPFVVGKLKEYFPGDPMMLCIAQKESTGLIHWLPSGELIPVKDHDGDGERDSSAVGVLQTLAYLHGPDLKRLGLKLTNIDEYMRFNRYLQRTQGYNAWKSSYKKCEREGVKAVTQIAMK